MGSHQSTMKKKTGSQESTIKKFEKFTWKIENFSRLNAEKICSEPFILCGYPWKIVLHPKGNKNRDVVYHLSIYLEAIETANMSKGWNRDVKFKLVVFNQLDTNRTIIRETKQDFNAKNVNCGFVCFMDLNNLHNPEKGFIVKDACIVGAEVFVSKSIREKQAVNINVSPVSIERTKKVDAELRYTALRRVIHFFKTRKVKDMNEQVDSELGHAALGRVIIFLQTNKVKDMMNEKTHKELQVLWDELKKFKFDLNWLEPQVQSALGMKSYVEKGLQVEKLKENVAVSELETERLKAKLAAAEVNFDIERDLLKAKDIKVRDLDSQLGSGSWKP